MGVVTERRVLEPSFDPALEIFGAGIADAIAKQDRRPRGVIGLQRNKGRHGLKIDLDAVRAGSVANMRRRGGTGEGDIAETGMVQRKSCLRAVPADNQRESLFKTPGAVRLCGRFEEIGPVSLP